MTTDTEALRAQFEKLLSDSGRAFLYEGDGHYAYPHDFSWLCYQAGHAAAKADTATVGTPMAMVQCHGSAEHPIYTAEQLAAAVAAERERAAMVCERIADDYNRREGFNYPELKTDAETGADECANAIRAGAKEASDA